MFEEALKIISEKKEQGQLKFWRLHEVNEKQREYYVLGEPRAGRAEVILDQARQVNQTQVQLEVWVDKGTTQGFASKSLFVGRDLKEQIEECLAQALVSSEKPWAPPAPSHQFDERPHLCYQALSEDFLKACDEVYSQLVSAIQETPVGIFNSSELFCVYTEGRTQASNGHSSHLRRSRFYAEVCFSSQENGESQEFLVTEWAVHPEQLEFRRMCDESSKYAEALLAAEPVPQAEYTVLLHADVLNEVFHDLSSHLDARSKYYQMPFKAEGEMLIPGFEGDTFSLRWNPGRDWAMGSRCDDGWGRSLPALILSADNKVMATAASSQMSQYLEIPASTDGGCLDLDTQGKPLKDLIEAQSTLEILQFSGLFTSSVDLTFSSEIRLARLWNPDGSFVYLKGGSLSGSVNDHLKSVQFSNKFVCHNKFQKGGSLSYYGPEKALLRNVPVTA